MASFVVKFGLLSLVLGMFCMGIFDMLKNFEENRCEMTYMYELPQYMKIDLGRDVQTIFPVYNLYLYGEGISMLRLKGIPVLFIPGNAGSYRQVRSLGSVALRFAESMHHNFHFNFFSLDFNEELSGLYGPVLPIQTEFAYRCLKHILSLYYHLPESQRPKSVVVIGHSMGGLVARSLFTLPDFDLSTVHTIITQATPHRYPVIALDPYMVDFYDHVNMYWLQNSTENLDSVSVLSTGGGYRDILVREGLTTLENIANEEHSISSSTMSVPDAWVSTDHVCHVWCRQIVLATIRALFDLVNKNTKQVAVNPSYRKKVFRHHFVKNPGIKYYRESFELMTKLENYGSWDVMKRSWRLFYPTVESPKYASVIIPKVKGKIYEFVAVSNVDSTGWVGLCSVPQDSYRCKEIGNFAYRANLIPPGKSLTKAVHLDWDKLDTFTHVVVSTPRSIKPVITMGDLFEPSKRYIVHNVTSLVDFFWNFPSRILSKEVIINSTLSRALFYNIGLRGLEIPLQAFRVHVDCIRCNNTISDGREHTVIKFVVPWSNQHTVTVLAPGASGTVSAKLQSGKPEDSKLYPQLYFYVMPPCSYRITISISWAELFGQFVRFYGVYVVGYVVIQILMGLSFQLMMLDEKGEAPSFVESHSRWAQPYRVGIVAMGLRLLFNYPEDDNVAQLLGLPPDDITILQHANIWYQALPVLLYLVAYSFIAFYGYFIHAVVASIGCMLGPVYNRLCTSSLVYHLATRSQYLMLLLGAASAYWMCGSIGIIASYIVYLLKTMTSYMHARKQSSASTELKIWNAFHINMTIALLLMMLLGLNAVSFVIWIKNFSLDSIVLANDPTRTTGVLACFAALLLIYVDTSLIFHELTSVMGAVAYMCSVLLVLFATISIYRISYFINATLMTVALPSALITWHRRRQHVIVTNDKPKSE